MFVFPERKPDADARFQHDWKYIVYVCSVQLLFPELRCSAVQTQSLCVWLRNISLPVDELFYALSYFLSYCRQALNWFGSRWRRKTPDIRDYIMKPHPRWLIGTHNLPALSLSLLHSTPGTRKSWTRTRKRRHNYTNNSTRRRFRFLFRTHSDLSSTTDLNVQRSRFDEVSSSF